MTLPQRIAPLRFLCCFFLPMMLSASLHAEIVLPTSGFYGDHTVQLVVAADGSFSGSFYDEAGGGNSVCQFLLHGDGSHSKHGVYPVTTWWPYDQFDSDVKDEVVGGKLRFSAKGLTLQLPRRAHYGCGDVNRKLGAGDSVELKRGTQETLWHELRIVKAKHSTIRLRPDMASEAHADLEQGDVLVSVATRGEWMHITFYSYTAAKSFSGWVETSDLLPFDVPALQAAPK